MIDPAIAENNGRIVKLMGDGMLIEFASVVDAVRASVTIQRAMGRHKNQAAAGQGMEFRFGINVGEVVLDDGDIYGDGVNVAARLQEIADPGGIAVSDRVYADVHGKLDIGFEDTGPQRLKNIPDPVRVYRVTMNGDGQRASRPSKNTQWAAMVGLIRLLAIAMIAAGAYWWQPWNASAPIVAGARTEKPSIAVLPFHNMSEDKSQSYFADGMAEDIITDLSKLSGLLVTSRNSSFANRGDNIDIGKVDRNLGVKFVLYGSVYRADDQVQINVQLIDVASGAHLWAERYTGSLQDVFALQDQVSRKIIDALTVKLNPAEEQALTKNETGNAEAYELVLRGIRHLNVVDQFHKEDNDRAKNNFQKAIELDGEYARAYAGLAWTHWNKFTSFNLLGSEKTLALAMARKSIELNDNSLARTLVAQTYFQTRMAAGEGRQVYTRDYGKALSELRKAVALEPNNADVMAQLAYTLAYAGEVDEAEKLMANARRLNPNFPSWYSEPAGIFHYLKGNNETAIREIEPWYQRTISRSSFAPAPLWLAAALAQAGRKLQAEAVANKISMEKGKGIHYGPNLLAIRLATPLKKPEHLDIFIDGLRRPE